ncbi:hypothetical protein [Paracoccus sp. MC1862]|uniref:hypothetical protein n=1 Tax=Paracoccus sp. MC1862 TaxID=2760307 RepID=UPI0016038312|nr:hypothetical protein [Paracoccus sp. MC1862]MBB1499457.1 hypothetical protein [Paracoccus sp. MC1862]QQO46006.1 hypothetical protein JGR78_06925 [Paracoccus sp. MC1862]
MNLPRSAFYYRATSSGAGPTDAEMTALIEDIQDEFLASQLAAVVQSEHTVVAARRGTNVVTLTG